MKNINCADYQRCKWSLKANLNAINLRFNGLVFQWNYTNIGENNKFRKKNTGFNFLYDNIINFITRTQM